MNPFLLDEESEEEVDDSLYGEEESLYQEPEIDPADAFIQMITPALTDTESNGNPNAVSPKGAMGSMQVMPTTWEAYGGGDPYDPEENTRVGQAILKDEFNRYGGNQNLALAAYNYGATKLNKAISQAGFDPRDPANIPFDAVAPYLPQETQDYVPKVWSKFRAMQGTENAEDAPLVPEGGEEVPSPEDNEPQSLFEIEAGSRDDLWGSLEPVISSPEFSKLTTNEAIQTLRSEYGKKRQWDDDAKSLMKELTSAVWDAATPDSKPDYQGLIGPPPNLDSKNEPAAKKELETWRVQKLKELHEMGLDPVILGDGLDKYIDEATKYETEAWKYRQRGTLGHVVKGATDFAKASVQGLGGALESTAAAPFRVFGGEGIADEIEKDRDILPDPSLAFQVDVNESGYPNIDEYGEYKNNLRASIAQGIGQVASVFATGGAAAALKAPGIAVSGLIGGMNTLQIANDSFKSARENGGTEEEARLAAFMSMPSAALDTLGDLAVMGGGKVWIKALSTPNKAIALVSKYGQRAARGALIEGSTEAGQQLMQDAAVSKAIGKNIISGDRILEAGLVGGIVGGAVNTVTGRPDIPEIGRTPVTTDTESALESEEEQLALPSGTNAPQLMLPAPETQGQLGTEVISDPRLQLPYSPQQSTVEAGQTLSAFDKPNPEEELRIAGEFQKLQDSPEMDKVITISNPKDLDAALPKLFGLQVVPQGDGTTRVIKQTAYIPPDPVNLTPEGINSQIEALTQEIASTPKLEDAESLIDRRKEITQELKTIEPRVKAETPAIEQLQARKKELTQDITRLKREGKKVPQKLLESRLKDAREELELIDGYLEDAPEVRRVSELQTELRGINDSLKQMLGNPGVYSNNLKAKENVLRDLVLKRDIGESEFQGETEQKEGAETKARTEEENRNVGIGIKSGNKTRYVLPFDNQWYVLDDQGTPLTKGLGDITQALDFARGIEETESEGKLSPAIGQKPVRATRPLKFKQKIEVPFFVVTPGPRDRDEQGNLLEEKVPRRTEDKTKSQKVKRTRKQGNEMGKGGNEASPLPESSDISARPSEAGTRLLSREEPSVSNSPSPDIAERKTAPIKNRLSRSKPNEGRTPSSDYVSAPVAPVKDSKVSPRNILSKARNILSSLGVYEDPNSPKVKGRTSKVNPYGIREGGRMTSKKSLGYIDYKNRFIHNRDPNDPQTLVHEAAHAIQTELFPKWEALPQGLKENRKLKDALTNTALDYYPMTPEDVKNFTPEQLLSEGWTTFMQHYMTGQPVNKDILDFYQNRFKEIYPELHKDLESLKQDVTDYYTRSSEAQATDFTSGKASPEWGLPGITQLRDEWENRHLVLEDIDAIAGTKLANTIATGLGAGNQKVAEIMESGFSDWAGNKWEGEKSLKEALAPAKNAKQLQELTNYLVAKYTVARAEPTTMPDGTEVPGKTTGLPLDDAENIINKVESDPTYQPVVQSAENYYRWRENVMDLASMRSRQMNNYFKNVEADNQRRTGTKHGYYIPFAREFEKAPGFYGQGAVSPTASNPFKRFSGSTLRILNPLTKLESNVHQTLSAADTQWKTDLMVDLVKAGSPVAKFIREVPSEMVPALTASVKEVLGQVNRKLAAEGKEPVDIDSPEVMEEFLTFFRPDKNTPKAAQGYVTVPYPTEKGVKFYEVHPRMLNVLDDSLPELLSNPLVKIFWRGPASLVREGATTFMDTFQLKNFLAMDFMTLYRSTNVNNPFKLGAMVMQSLGQEFMYSATNGKYVPAAVALSQRIAARAANQININREISDQIQRQTGKPVIDLGLVKGFRFLGDLLTSGERASRLTAMKIALKEVGVTDFNQDLTPEQAMAAVEAYKFSTTNYQIQGSKARAWNTGIPFLTARIAQLSRLRRDIKEHPKKLAAYSAAFFALGIQQALSNYEEDDPWWDELDTQQKGVNYLTKVNIDGQDKILKIPLETVGGFWNTLGNIVGDSLRSDKTDITPEAYEHMQSLAKNYFPVSSGAEIVGPIFKEAFQQFANEDFFFNKAIVPEKLTDAPRQSQYTVATTETAKELAGIINSVTGSYIDIPPARLEHAVRSIFPAAISITKKVENVTGVKPIVENKGLLESAFVKSGYSASVMDRSTEKFWEEYDKFQQGKDAELPAEGDKRKKLTKLGEQLSAINTVLTEEEDPALREDLYRRKLSVLRQGLAISQGTNVGSVGKSTLDKRAKQIRQSRRKAEAERIRAESAEDYN